MKILCKVLALIFVCALVFSLVACDNKTYQYSEGFVLEEFTDIVKRIEDHRHIHTEDVLPGMTEEEFAPVEQAIHVAIHDGGYTISNNGTEDFIDDDGNHVYITGSISFTASSSAITVFTIPSGYRPKQGVVLWAVASSNFARIQMYSNGQFKVDAVYDQAGNKLTSGTVSWCSIQMDYFVD
jgi:hypothetical protein